MRPIVFTDLDGTLLDHDTYSWKAARPALTRLRELGSPLIPVTSKTRAEVEVLRRELDLDGPFVTENGGGIFFPAHFERQQIAGAQPVQGFTAVVLGRPYSEAREFIETVRSRYSIEGFGDMSLERISELTGLSSQQSDLASRREFTEPFLIASEDDLESLRHEARQEGFAITTGGRLHHLIGENQDKGRAVERVADYYRSTLDNSGPTIGLGDSVNDLPMLEAVDIPVVIPRHDDQILGLENPRAMVAPQPGSTGWNDALLELLSQLYSGGY